MFSLGSLILETQDMTQMNHAWSLDILNSMTALAHRDKGESFELF